MTISNALSRIGVCLFLCSGSVVLAQGPPPGAGPPGGTPGNPPGPPTLTVQVDCDNGESINDALATPAVELTIVITGTCIENLVIARDLVTLRGANFVGGALPPDGIMGVPDADDPPHFGNVILIRDAVFVNVEDLFIDGGNGGIAVYRSGASTEPGGGSITLRRVTMEGDSEADLVILGASVVRVFGGTVGNAEILGSSVLVMRRAHLTGGVLARGGSRVALQGVFQDPGILNTVTNDAVLFVRCANCEADVIPPTMGVPIPSELGDISVERLSRALITDGTILEILTCSDGSDAFCDGTETKSSSDCSLCPEF